MLNKGKIALYLARTVFVVGFVVTSTLILFVEVNGLVKLRRNQLIVNQSNNKSVLGVILGEAKETGENPVKANEMIVSEDARPEIIKRYLAKYKSPLLPHSDLIFQLSQTYGFDYRWIVAIAQQESNLCKKIPEGSYNCWGYGIHKNGTLRFENYEIALKSYAEYLDREYFKKGYETPEEIMKKYCPSSNGSWAYGVRHFMDDMEKGNI